MKASEFKKFDQSLEFIQGENSGIEFLGLAGLTGTEDHRVLFVKNKKFLGKFIFPESRKNMALLVEKKFWDDLNLKNSPEVAILKSSFSVLLTVNDVNLAMSWLSKPFYDLKHKNRNNQVDGRQMGSAEVHPTALIAQNVFLGEGVKVHADAEILSGCVILAGCEIGEGTKLYPNVTVYEDVKIGKHCRIHANTAIGSDGFGYNFHQGNHVKVWHTGSVIIHDHVEIGACVSIDQGTFEPTIIGTGSKIDNQVQIGHNCILGRGVILCGQVGLSGSGKVGDYNIFAGKAGMGPDTTLGKGVQIAAGGMVSQDWPDGSIIAGHPARPLNEWMKGLATLRKLSLDKTKSEK
ncbi:MAG: UDP-3-O-(3-hydroxymyristoyl)glucosamine N-acyltransferase [Bacteriovoracaceae bacterium]